MGFGQEHEIHKRRFGRNLGLGLVLAGFAALMFALTVAKVTRDGPIEGYVPESARQTAPAGGG